MNDLISNIRLLGNVIKNVHSQLAIKSVKDNSLKPLVTALDRGKSVLINILDNIQNLSITDPNNLFICYENDIYLSVENNKYIIVRDEGGEARLLATKNDLKDALKEFYWWAYENKINKK